MSITPKKRSLSEHINKISKITSVILVTLIPISLIASLIMESKGVIIDRGVMSISYSNWYSIFIWLISKIIGFLLLTLTAMVITEKNRNTILYTLIASFASLSSFIIAYKIAHRATLKYEWTVTYEGEMSGIFLGLALITSILVIACIVKLLINIKKK